MWVTMMWELLCLSKHINKFCWTVFVVFCCWLVVCFCIVCLGSFLYLFGLGFDFFPDNHLILEDNKMRNTLYFNCYPLFLSFCNLKHLCTLKIWGMKGNAGRSTPFDDYALFTLLSMLRMLHQNQESALSTEPEMTQRYFALHRY